MELFGIVCAVPAAFIVTAILVQALDVLSEQPAISRLLFWCSVVVLAGLTAEWLALVAVGPVGVREMVGPTFYRLHTGIIVLALPATATVLALGVSRKRSGSWWVIPALCAFLAMPVAVTQYWVAESLYGIDGKGGPYGDAPTLL